MPSDADGVAVARTSLSPVQIYHAIEKNFSASLITLSMCQENKISDGKSAKTFIYARINIPGFRV
jgi:hypothetical protein